MASSSLQDTREHSRVLRLDPALSGLTADSFMLQGRPAKLALAYVTPATDFAETAKRLKALAGATPLLCLSTSGELFSAGPQDTLYTCPAHNGQSVVVQLFADTLIEAVDIHFVPLHSEDIRKGHLTVSEADRVVKITAALADVTPAFPINHDNTVALTFLDGLSASEMYFMEAVYRSGRFPCHFVGGSTGTQPGGTHTGMSDGVQPYENHACLCLIRLAPGANYDILKSQNFKLTERSLYIGQAHTETRTAYRAINPVTGEIIPIIDAVARLFGCAPEEIEKTLAHKALAVKIDDDFYIRSISKVDLEGGQLFFYGEVNHGDQLYLVEATDFATQTRADVGAFLAKHRVAPGGVILNDCILRRVYYAESLPALDGLWGAIPVAGFSTFGELAGININQTLTALAFYPKPPEGVDPLITQQNFPVQYARYTSYFMQREVNRIISLSALRSRIIQSLNRVINESPGGGSELTLLEKNNAVLLDLLSGCLEALPPELAGQIKEDLSLIKALTEKNDHLIQKVCTGSLAYYSMMAMVKEQMLRLKELER